MLRARNLCIVIIMGLVFMFGLFPVFMQPSNYGKIAFSSDRDGMGHHIYVMDADGSNQTRLSNGPCPHFFPAWSPDGKKIAFDSACEVLQVYVMDADGSNVLNLSISSYDNAGPTWTPDGGKIALSAYKDGIWGIFVMDADGSNAKNLTEFGSDAAWSPDGKKITFARGSNIYVINVDGTNLKWINDNGSFPTWSPDGEKIAFVSDRDGNGEIYVMYADGSNQVNLTNNPADDRDPAWCCQPLMTEEPFSSLSLPFILVITVLAAVFVILFLKLRNTLGMKNMTKQKNFS